MIRRFLGVVVVILSLVGVSPAQVSTSGLNKAESLGKTVYGLGFSGGPASGIGFSFRAHMPSKNSFQAVFGIIKTQTKLLMSAGVEYQYDLVRGNSTRFFFVGSTGYFYSGNGQNDVAGPFRLGAGIGGEFQVRDALHATIEGQFVYSSDGTVLPLPQLAIHYYFF
jgi:hypothetical protein